MRRIDPEIRRDVRSHHFLHGSHIYSIYVT